MIIPAPKDPASSQAPEPEMCPWEGGSGLQIHRPSPAKSHPAVGKGAVSLHSSSVPAQRLEGASLSLEPSEILGRSARHPVRPAPQTPHPCEPAPGLASGCRSLQPLARQQERRREAVCRWDSVGFSQPAWLPAPPLPRGPRPSRTFFRVVTILLGRSMPSRLQRSQVVDAPWMSGQRGRGGSRPCLWSKQVLWKPRNQKEKWLCPTAI